MNDTSKRIIEETNGSQPGNADPRVSNPGDPPRPGFATVETFTGRYIDLAHPDPALIVLEDLAHHLATCNRYAGACLRPYSVGEHVLLVSRRLEDLGEPWRVVLWGLHHDDAEFIMHDVTRPFKEIVGPLYRPAEAKMMNAIANALDLPDLTPEQVQAIHYADNWALAKEAHVLMRSRGVGWWCEGLYDRFDEMQNIEALNIPAHEVSFRVIKNRYLSRHNYITERI